MRKPRVVGIAVIGVLSLTACGEQTETDTGQGPPNQTLGTCMADGPIYRSVEEALVDTEVVVVGVAERSTRAPSTGAPAGADEWTIAITDDLGAEVGGSIDMVAVAVDLQAEPCRPGVVEGRDSLFLLSNGRGSDESLVHYPIAVLVETADGGYADAMRGLGMPDLPPDLGTAAELFRELNARS